LHWDGWEALVAFRNHKSNKAMPGTTLIKLLNLKVSKFSHGHPTTIGLSSGGNVPSGGIISSAMAFMTGTPGQRSERVRKTLLKSPPMVVYLYFGARRPADRLMDTQQFHLPSNPAQLCMFKPFGPGHCSGSFMTH